MDNVILWGIIALFYAPLHYLVPLLIVFFRYADQPELRRSRLIATAIDCSLSMVASFGLVIALAGSEMFTAMMILLFSMALPYVRIFLAK